MVKDPTFCQSASCPRSDEGFFPSEMIKEFDLNNNNEGINSLKEFYELLNKWNNWGGAFWKYWY